ncbi:DUF3900 domain-containing protein [Natrinema pellirubrum]|uniref:DUF3900 domain-containing protein n=1 Tax=Natrinema pellirubrum TaxID=69525 RepID=UPI0012FCEF88|nr:DUF3900 domain-containing protein [Natrinema pellirubrum]
MLAQTVEGDNIKENLKTLASWYLQTDYAQSGLLLVTRFHSHGDQQVGIIKAPFVDDIYEPDDEDILNELNEVIKGDLKKGILYPRITPDGECRWDEVCLYQKQGSSSRYPKHWFQYLHLKPNPTSEEILSEMFEEEENELSEAESTEEFDEIVDNIDDITEEAEVSIKIGGREVKIEIGEILRRDRVHLVESEEGYHLVISGDEPTIRFYDNRRGEYREVLKGIESFDSIDDIIS